MQRARQGWRRRLHADFRLTIISLFGLCTVIAILPMSVYRFAVGDWLTGIGDVLLVSVFTILVAYAWKTGRTGLVARLLAVVMTLGFLTLVIFGQISELWAFPILGAGFLLADRVFASISAILTLVVTVYFSGRIETAVDAWSFLSTGILSAMFGLIFASRTRAQQRELFEIASRDPLTRAGNRRALRRALDQVEREHDRRGTPASLILMDLDHFKSVNDVYGHAAGDRILINLVDLLIDRLRDEDGVFRLGGEEFVVLLPDADLDSAERVAGKLKRTLAGRLEGPGGPVTVSMGVAEFDGNENIRSWLSRADEALYEAKRRGRDRIRTSRSTGP